MEILELTRKKPFHQTVKNSRQAEWKCKYTLWQQVALSNKQKYSCYHGYSCKKQRSAYTLYQALYVDNMKNVKETFLKKVSSLLFIMLPLFS